MFRFFIAVFLASAVALSPRVATAGDEPGEKAEEAKEREQAAKARLLQRITVVGMPGRNGEIPGSVHRISRRELDAQNQAYDDIHRILFRLPGVNVSEEDGYGLRPNIGMRATGTDRSSNITLMEDGILAAPAPYAAPAAYYFPLAGRMEGIEVRKGSSQIKYGPRTNGGAINLVSTSIPESRGGRAQAAAGGDGTRKLHTHYGDTWKNVGWMLETYQLESDGFKQLDTGGETGFDLADYVGKIRVSTGAEAATYQELTLKLGYTEETSNETYLGLTAADFAANPARRYAASRNDVMTNEHRSAQARHFITAGDDVDVTTTAYRNEFERNWYKLDSVSGTKISKILENPETYASEYDVITGTAPSDDDALSVKANNRGYFSQGVESILGVQFGPQHRRHDMEVGVRFHEDEEDRFQHADLYRMEAGGAMTITTRGVPGARGGGDNRVNRARAVAAFCRDNITMGRLTLAPGVRFESIRTERRQYQANDPGRTLDPETTKSTTNVLAPGVGASYRANESLTLLAGLHKGFAPPGPGSDDRAEAEESINVELGARMSRGRARISVLGFYNDYANLLGKDTFSGGGEGTGDLFNAGEVNAYGVEASLDLEVAPAGAAYVIPFRMSYTMSVAEFQNSFESDFEPWGSVTKGDRLPYIPEHQLSATLGLTRSRWRFNVFGNYTSAARTVAGQGNIPAEFSADSRAIFDASAEYLMTSKARAFVSMQNIADKTYVAARRPAGLRPGLPRTVLAGLKLEL